MIEKKRLNPLRNKGKSLYLHRNRENSSVGRAQPCQGWGRGFESRFSLQVALVVELVDTQDLKSCDHCDRAGSSPARGTNFKSQLQNPLSNLFQNHTTHTSLN